MADKPQGVYHYGGTIVSNGDIGLDGRTVPCNYTGTNHGSIVEINGQWYVFYHRQTNRTPYSRQGCAEKITLLPDGSIPQVRVTSCGLNNGPLKIGYSYPAGIACCLQTANGAGPYRAKTTIGEEHPYITQDGPDGDILPSSMLPTCAMAPTRATAAFCCIPVPILQLPIAALAMVRWKLPQRKVVPRPLYSR